MGGPPSLTVVPLETDVAAALSRVPEVPGAGQIRGPEGRNLLIGRASSLRRWFAANLGKGPPARTGQRPRLDLTPIATALAYLPSTSEFHQRLLYERLMAPHVPFSARRDLKKPAFLRLDPGERFPRASVVAGAADGRAFGPFRDRRAAARAVEALHERFPIRPCDFVFEPAPELALGLSCLYAQVRSCVAPCLARVSEADYRALAAKAEAFLDLGAGRPEDIRRAVPAWVDRATARVVVAEAGSEGIELYPLRDGRLFEEGAALGPPEALAERLSALQWPGSGGQDWPWVLAWLHAPRRKGAYLVWDEAEPPAALAARVVAALAGSGRGPAAVVT